MNTQQRRLQAKKTRFRRANLKKRYEAGEISFYEWLRAERVFSPSHQKAVNRFWRKVFYGA